MISIIIPHRNHNHLLRRAIASAMAQNTDKEIIVVDNHSDIIPLEIVEGLPVLFMVKDGTLMKVRNEGVRHSGGEYIIQLDADDEMLPNVLEKMMEQFDENTDILYGNMFQNGVHLIPNKDIKLEDLLRNNQLFHGASIYRRKVWKELGGYWEASELVYDDWDFWGRAMKAGSKFKYSDIDVYNYNFYDDKLGGGEVHKEKIREHIKNA